MRNQLDTENQRLKEEQEHQKRTIQTLEEQAYKLNGENQSLQSKLERLEQHEVAFKNTVSKLKMKLSLALEDLSRIDNNLDDNTLLVSCLP